MSTTLRDSLATAVQVLLTPLVKVLLRNGIPFGAFAELARKTYVEVARSEFGVEGRKLSNSRIALLTGLTRKEVKRLLELERVDSAAVVARYDRATRVVSGWTRDARFQDADGQPAALPFENGAASFSDLVRTFGGDVPARAMLDELEGSGAVQVDETRRVRLRQRAYLPNTAEEECVRILGTDVADLIDTIDHNMTRGDDPPFFQRKVAYDHLPEECLEELREIARRRGQELLEELDGVMAEHDRDFQPERGGSGRKRAMLGIYYYDSDAREEPR